MRKTYLLFCGFLAVLNMSAQGEWKQKFDFFMSDAKAKADYKVWKTEKGNSRAVQASGDTLWSSDFSNADDFIASGFVVRTDAPGGIFAGLGPINSETAENGFAGFYSFDDGSSGTIQNAAAIDLSGTNAAYLTFSSYYIRWYESISVAVRNSAGVADTIGLHFDVPFNYASSNSEDVTINISAVAGDTAVYVEWIYDGPVNGYAWMIDDAAVIESEDNDVGMYRAYSYMNGIGAYGLIPASLADSFYGYADVYNNGKETATAVGLQLRLQDDDVNVDTLMPSTDTTELAVGETKRVFTETDVFYNAENGIYDLSYYLNQSERDGNFGNNNQTDVWSVFITDTTYGRAMWYHSSAQTYSTWGSQGSENGAMMGATYFIYDSTEISSLTAVLDSKTTDNVNLVGKIYYSDNAGMMREVARTDTFNAGEISDRDSTYTLKFLKNDTIDKLWPCKPLSAVESTEWPDFYFVGVEMQEGVTSHTLALVADYSTFHNHGWSSMIYVPVVSGWYANSSTPHVYLNIAKPEEIADTTDNTDTTATDSTNSINELLAAQAVIYPNPSENIVHVEGMEGANIAIINILGKTVFAKEMMSDKEAYFVGDLPKGTYLMQFTKGDAVAYQRVVLGN